MIRLEWDLVAGESIYTLSNTRTDSFVGTDSISFQIEQWYEISSQNEVPRYRTESNFTVNDAVIKLPDEIFVTLILTAQGTGVTTSREFAYGVLKRLSDNGVIIRLDASEQGTRTSYDNVVIKRMSNIVRVNEEYFCKLVFSEIRMSELSIALEEILTPVMVGQTLSDIGEVEWENEDIQWQATQAFVSHTPQLVTDILGETFGFAKVVSTIPSELIGTFGDYSPSDDYDKLMAELSQGWTALVGAVT